MINRGQVPEFPRHERFSLGACWTFLFGLEVEIGEGHDGKGWALVLGRHVA